MKIERIQKLIKQCDELGALISHWQRSFLDSVEKQLLRGRTLSTKQLAVVHRLESKITKVLEGDPDWENEWTEQKATDFNIAVRYYNSTDVRYHSQILDWAKDNPNTVPPRDFYQKLVENKYAQKIINAINSEPKYPAGSTVMLRANCRNGVSFEDWNKIQSSMLFVIKATDRAINPAAGCRIYSLLSSTSAEVFEIEERWIKKYRPPKDTKKEWTDPDIPF